MMHDVWSQGLRNPEILLLALLDDQLKNRCCHSRLLLLLVLSTCIGTVSTFPLLDTILALVLYSATFFVFGGKQAQNQVDIASAQ